MLLESSLCVCKGERESRQEKVAVVENFSCPDNSQKIPGRFPLTIQTSAVPSSPSGMQCSARAPCVQSQSCGKASRACARHFFSTAT